MKLELPCSLSNSGIRCWHIDTTNTCTILHLETHVAILTPFCAPIVPHDPILISRVWVRPEANQNDSMVQGCSTLWTIEDAMFVLDEHVWVALDGRSDGLLSYGCLELWYVKWLYIVSLSDLDINCFILLVARSILALSIKTCIWVVLLEHKVMLLVVVEGIINTTTFATIWVRIAID